MKIITVAILQLLVISVTDAAVLNSRSSGKLVSGEVSEAELKLNNTLPTEIDGMLNAVEKSKRPYKFESCQKSLVQHSSSVKDEEVDTESQTGDNAACPANKVVLGKERITGVTKTCGNADSINAAGCAQMSGANCAECVGGYQKEHNRCTICADVAHWVDHVGNACAKTTCSNTMTSNTTSNDACCKCGGGQREATPFTFPEVILNLGATIASASLGSFAPIPRTATRYSVDSKCPVGKYGIQVDSVTGALKPMALCTAVGCGVTEAFEASCVLTAYQGNGLNATATLLVRGTKFAYKSKTIVMRPGSFTANPVQTVTAAKMYCVPSAASSWLSISAAGVLSTTQAKLTTAIASTGVAGVVSDKGLGSMGAQCTVSGTIGTTVHQTSVTVYAPQIWSSISYGTTATSMFTTIGEELLPMVVKVADKSKLAPHRYSAACTTTAKYTDNTPVKFVFDTVTGVGTLDGHSALTVDVKSGTVTMAPVAAMVSVFNNLDRGTNSRGTIRLECKVFGHYSELPQFLSRNVASSKITVDIRDSTCWLGYTASTVTNINCDLARCDVARQELWKLRIVAKNFALQPDRPTRVGSTIKIIKHRNHSCNWCHCDCA
jgi:hypothetical protein